MMKLLKYISFFALLGLVMWSCEEEEYGQTVVSFVDNRTGTVYEGSDDVVTATLMLSSIPDGSGTVTITLPDDMIETVPANNGRNLTITFPEGETSATFQLKYKDDEVINERQRMLPVTISSTGGAIESVGNEIFYLEVIDNDVSALEQDFDELCENEISLGSLGWTVYNVSSEYTWRCTTPNRGSTGVAGDYGLEMNNYGSPDGEAGDDWLITPKLTFSDTSSLSFTSVKRYGGSTIEVLISSDYIEGEDPTEYTWTEISAATNAFDDDIESWDYISSGKIDISEYSGVNYIAFRVISPGTISNQASTVRVDNIRVGGVAFTVTQVPDGGGDGDGDGDGDNGDALEFPFSTDFEGCTTNFSTPDLFIEEFVEGSQTDRGWGCREFGVDGSRAVRASAFKSSSAEGYDDAWLITEAPIDMSSASDVYIHFMVSSMYDGPGTILLKWSESYSGSGDPSAASWTAIDISSQLPAAGSNSYVQVSTDVSSLVGKKAYIAIQYIDAQASSAASWDIDNFEVTDSSTPGSF